MVTCWLFTTIALTVFILRMCHRYWPVEGMYSELLKIDASQVIGDFPIKDV